jgi:phosphoglycerol transferase MdoB-like AlkP superfamily enzyme
LLKNGCGAIPFNFIDIERMKSLRSNYYYWRPVIGLFLIFPFVFIFFRSIFYLLNTERISTEFLSMRWEIFWLSFRFDLMISAYCSILTWLLVSLKAYIPSLSSNVLFKVLMIWFVVLDLFVLLLICSDIPYYTFFNERINPAVILWINNPQMMLSFLADASEYYPFFVLFFLSVAVLIYLQRRMLKNWREQTVSAGLLSKGIPIALGALLFLAMRGGIQIRPLEVRDAFISGNNYINQFSLNPVLSYLNNFVNQNTSYLSDEEFDQFLTENKIDLNRPFPLSKSVEGDSMKKWNVVLVLMESMTGNMLNEYGNTENITPFLDSMTRVSLNVKGMYSTGTHTCNGIYSSLYGFPSFMSVHPMSNPTSVAQDFYGLPQVLKEFHYQTMFFTSHSRHWDNMEVFLTKNGFDTIYDITAHPHKKQVNAFGVPDEIVFETSLKKLDAHSQKGPMFATILTVSTHVPYVIAPYSKFPKSLIGSDPQKNIYRYADWCLKEFFREAAKKPWFNNTLFVFVADHGINLEPEMDMPLSFHRAPLIFYKQDLAPQQLEVMASQTDIFPTVMGLLGASYQNNTMGLDLRKEQRRYSFFVGSSTIGCVDTSHLYVYRKFGSSTLTRIGDKSQQDLSNLFSDKKNSLEKYALGNLQLCDYILENRKAGKPR